MVYLCIYFNYYDILNYYYYQHGNTRYTISSHSSNHPTPTHLNPPPPSECRDLARESKALIVYNLSELLLSIIIQDLIIHNKDLTNNNNYFNRTIPDSCEWITSPLYGNTVTRVVFSVCRSVKGGGNLIIGAAFISMGGAPPPPTLW